MNEEKKFSILEGYSEKLIVDYNDTNYVKVNQRFLNVLDEEYEMFIKRLNSENKKNKKYIELAIKEKMLFYPEVLARRSPITLINAPWGSGKTYFIESLIRNFLDKKVKTKEFEKIIILDVWKYSNSENPQKDIMENLFEILSNTSEKLKKFLNKWGKKLINVILIPQINSFGFGFGKVKEKSKKSGKNFENKSINFPKTIIFFDNLERLGNQSWDVLKSIMRLAQFENFIIILPMNVKRLANNNLNSNDEYPIEKFIDIKYFEFESNYFSFLNKLNFNNREINLMNESLNESRDNRSISIREVKQRFESSGISNIENKYDKLQFLFMNIWLPSDNLKKYILNQVDVYINKLENLERIFDTFVKNMKDYFLLIKKELFSNITYEMNDSGINFLQTKWRGIQMKFNNFIKEPWILNCSAWVKDLNSFFNEIKKCNDFLKKYEGKEYLKKLISNFSNLNEDIELMYKEYIEDEEKMLKNVEKDLFDFSATVFKKGEILSTKDFGEKIYKSILNIDYKNESSNYHDINIYPHKKFYDVQTKQN